MNKFVLFLLIIVFICLNKSIVCSTTIQDKSLVKIEEVQWTNEDLEKAKQIIDYFKNHETQDADSDKMDEKNYGKYDDTREHDTSIDSWSIVWYVASFGGLIIFFLVVSCSEWCCKRQNNESSAVISGLTSQMGMQQSTSVIESPPPSYDLFAPPSYESLGTYGSNNNEKNVYDIYVVPVHKVRTVLNDEPPEYTTVNIHQNTSDLSTHSHA